MTNSFQEQLNAIQETITQTTEYKAVQDAIEAVKSDEQSLALFKQFREIQLNLQQKHAAGEEISGEELEYAQKTAQLAQQNEKIEQMLMAEMALSGLMDEFNKALMEPVQKLYETMA